MYHTTWRTLLVRVPFEKEGLGVVEGGEMALFVTHGEIIWQKRP